MAVKMEGSDLSAEADPAPGDVPCIISGESAAAWPLKFLPEELAGDARAATLTLTRG